MTTWNIANESIIDWAARYDGPPFHAAFMDAPYHLGSINARFGGEDAASAQEGRDGAFKRLSRGFMGEEWDGGDVAFQGATWGAIARHLLPGAFLISASGSRGWHNMAAAMEAAGLVVHPTIFCWLGAQGLTKATNLSVNIDRAAGFEPNVTRKAPEGETGGVYGEGMNVNYAPRSLYQFQTPDAQAWAGHRYGLQALKPAIEPFIVAQRPYEKSATQSIVESGAGALNIDACRVGQAIIQTQGGNKMTGLYGDYKSAQTTEHVGRWPANFVASHLPGCKRTGEVVTVSGRQLNRWVDGAKPFGGGAGHDFTSETTQDEQVEVYECEAGCPVRKLGERALFFTSVDFRHEETAERIFSADEVLYFPKAGRAERDFGLDAFAEVEPVGADFGLKVNPGTGKPRAESLAATKNPHPTVKPIQLNEWFAKLLLPPDKYAPRRLLVPFSGVASEMIGAGLAGWEYIQGVELTAKYIPYAEARMAAWMKARNDILRGWWPKQDKPVEGQMKLW